jgi:enoyl-CoA hydratase
MVHSELSEGIAVLRMEHGKVQALDLELAEDVERELDSAVRGARAIVLTGSGACFSAGVDLHRVVEGGGTYVARFLPALARLLRRLFECPLPLVTAINGHAVAGGALMAWCGDLRVMAHGAGRIGVPELRVGVPFPAVAVEILRFATGGRHLQELALLGRTYDPDTALQFGLVDELADQSALPARALDLAGDLARIAPESFALTKRALRQPFLDRLDREGPEQDQRATAIWQAPATHDAIRRYLATLASRKK